MLDDFNDQLCSKLCLHKIRMPKGEGIDEGRGSERKRERGTEGGRG